MTGKHSPEANALLRRIARLRRDGQTIGYTAPDPPKGGELTLDDLLRILIHTSAAQAADTLAHQLNEQELKED